MNPIKFLIEDLKSDWKAVKEIGEVVSGKKELPERVKTRFKTEFLHGWSTFFQDNWLFFLLLCLAFASGWFMSAKHYQNICNQYIYDTYIYPQVIERSVAMGNWMMSNITFK